MFLLKVVKKLDQHQIPYAIAGGYALALHGIVRATMDIDLILNLKKSDFIRFQKAMSELSLQPRLPLLPEQIIEFRKEYIETRNLIAWSFVNFQDPSEIVDLLLIEDLQKLKPVRLQLGQYHINVISLSDLARMKKASGRPQDLLDLEKINLRLKEK